MTLEVQHGHNKCFRHLESFGTLVARASMDVAPKSDDGRWTCKILREDLCKSGGSHFFPDVTCVSDYFVVLDEIFVNAVGINMCSIYIYSIYIYSKELWQ